MNYKKLIASSFVGLILGSTVCSSVSFADSVNPGNKENTIEYNQVKNSNLESMSNYLVKNYHFDKMDLKGLSSKEIKSLYEYGYEAKTTHSKPEIKMMYKLRTMLHHLQIVTNYHLESIKPYINNSSMIMTRSKVDVPKLIGGSTFLYHLWRMAVDSHWGYRTIYDALYHYYRDIKHYSHKHAEEAARREAHVFIRDTDRWDDIFSHL